jgi:hypothetical protein
MIMEFWLMSVAKFQEWTEAKRTLQNLDYWIRRKQTTQPWYNNVTATGYLSTTSCVPVPVPVTVQSKHTHTSSLKNPTLGYCQATRLIRSYRTSCYSTLDLYTTRSPFLTIFSVTTVFHQDRPVRSYNWQYSKLSLYLCGLQDLRHFFSSRPCPVSKKRSLVVHCLDACCAVIYILVPFFSFSPFISRYMDSLWTKNTS